MEDVSYGATTNQNPQRGRGARGRGGPRGRGHTNIPRGGHRQGLKDTSRSAQPARARGGRGGPLTRGTRGRGAFRGGPRSTTRSDTDGDTTMGEDSTKWRRNKDAAAAPSSNWVVVQNFAEGTDIQELTSFLVTNSATQINVLQCFMDGNRAFIQVSDSQQAFALKKLSGIFFQKQKLFIKQTDRENKRAATMEAVVPLIMSRYQADSKLLNLANLASTPMANLQIDFNNFGFVKSLLLAIAQKCPDVTSINFENNQIQSLTAFAQVSRILQSVVNISFENNIIQNFEELDNLKDLKLREIMLAKNPIQTQNTETKYHNEISKRFKGIKYLDGQKIQPLIDFGVDVNNLTSVNLPPIRGNLFDTPQTQQLVEGFVRKFLPLYDKDRNSLLDAYTDTAFFTVAVSIPKPKHGSAQPFAYAGKNRNVVQVTDINKRMKLTNVGRVNIISFANQLPATQHIIDATMKVDAFVQVIGNAQILQINLHGSFWEASGNSPTGIRRSYDRVFLLTPAPQDSMAAQQGWPAVILNDQLIIRNYVASKQENNNNNAVVASIPVDTPQLSQQQTVEKFVLVTSLKPEFAAQCLEQNQWNYDKAIIAFTMAKSNNQIPNEMFQVPPM